jgi:hypothetical protein
MNANPFDSNIDDALAGTSAGAEPMRKIAHVAAQQASSLRISLVVLIAFTSLLANSYARRGQIRAWTICARR